MVGLVSSRVGASRQRSALKLKTTFDGIVEQPVK